MTDTNDIPPPTIDRGPLGALPPTMEWVGGTAGYLNLLDQTLLPNQTEMRPCHTAEDIWEAIRQLRVRGAPAIGVAAAYGLCLGTRAACLETWDQFCVHVAKVAEYLRQCRPTAVNLAWALARIERIGCQHPQADPQQAWNAMLTESHRMYFEDADTCRRIGEAGAHLVPDGGGVITHCNAGSLATVAYGTALALLYVAHSQGKRFRVYADETRPLLQGARLTAYELAAAGLDVTVQCDSAAASLLRSGHAQMVVTGADRITANGDAANKIGTYPLALAAREHQVPFYVAAPRSTFDRDLPTGDQIPIEERPGEEIAVGFGPRTVPDGVTCRNPAFDVTPAALISALVTEVGLVQPVTSAGVATLWPPRSNA